MSETVIIAEQTTGAPGFLDRFPDGEWPVRQEDLDRMIADMAEARGMRVLSIGESVRRGPIPMHDVSDDGHMLDRVVADIAQLYAYVEWEPA